MPLTPFLDFSFRFFGDASATVLRIPLNTGPLFVKPESSAYNILSPGVTLGGAAALSSVIVDGSAENIQSAVLQAPDLVITFKSAPDASIHTVHGQLHYFIP